MTDTPAPMTAEEVERILDVPKLRGSDGRWFVALYADKREALRDHIGTLRVRIAELERPGLFEKPGDKHYAAWKAAAKREHDALLRADKAEAALAAELAKLRDGYQRELMETVHAKQVLAARVAELEKTQARAKAASDVFDAQVRRIVELEAELAAARLPPEEGEVQAALDKLHTVDTSCADDEDKVMFAHDVIGRLSAALKEAERERDEAKARAREPVTERDVEAMRRQLLLVDYGGAAKMLHDLHGRALAAEAKLETARLTLAAAVAWWNEHRPPTPTGTLPTWVADASAPWHSDRALQRICLRNRQR